MSGKEAFVSYYSIAGAYLFLAAILRASKIYFCEEGYNRDVRDVRARARAVRHESGLRFFRILRLFT
jgi:hypothetical protein